jgi:hypothetical protein
MKPSQQPWSIPTMQPSKVLSKLPSYHEVVIVVLSNVSFVIRGLTSNYFDSPATTALLTVIFQQHCNSDDVKCVTVLSMQNVVYSASAARTGVPLGLHTGNNGHLQSVAVDATSFVVEMRSVLNDASLGDVNQLMATQRDDINETFSAESICSEFINLALELDTNMINHESSCQFTGLKFSQNYQIYEVSTAEPSIAPTAPPAVVKSLLLFYVLVPSLVCFLLCGVFVYVLKRRRSAIIFARKQQYSASVSYFNRENSHKVRPGSVGYDIETFGEVVND